MLNSAKQILMASLIAITACAVEVRAETASASKPPATSKPSMIQAAEPSKPVSFNAKTLRRLDFKVVGKSCAVCLMGIQKKVKDMPGVVKAAVMLKRPYGAVIVYDSSKTTKDKLLEKARSQDKEVKIEQITDFSIQKLPTVLIPLYGIPTATASAETSAKH